MKKLLLVVLVLLGLQTQAQVSPCDSINYTITSSPNNIVLQLDGIVASGFPGVVTDWNWQVCNDTTCGGDTAQTVYFPNTFCTFTTADTLNLCLTTIGTMSGTIFTCIQCDTLVYGINGWMLMNMGNPTGINELEINSINYNKIYDLTGRELKEIPVGSIYIRNNKKYIRTK